MTKNIYAKVAEVMQNVSRVPKNGFNDFHKYKYTTESDLTESIRPILLDAGMAFFSNVLEQERDGEFTKVKMEFTLADIETGETLKSTYWGEGQDKGDKGLYKAYTGATKYFLMKTFLIPTGDDPEGDASVDERNNKQEPNYPKNNSKQISSKQVGLIKLRVKELEKLGGTEEAILNGVRSKVGDFKQISDMTSQQASQAIEILNEWKEKKSKETVPR